MLQLGRQGQLYGAAESTQGTVPSLSAASAIRHKNIVYTFDNKNRRTITEKKQSPWTVAAQRADGRKTGEFAYDGVLRPSGTLNTVPEVDVLLLSAFGSKTNVSLSTTVSSGGAVGGATVASSGTLAKYDFVLITCPDGKKRLRQLTAAPAANVLAWAPNLPAGQQPANGAAIKGVITYKLTAGNILTFALCHYLKKIDGSAGLSRAADMCGADKLTLKFDANSDPMLSLSGPCKEVVDPPSQPGGFTMVGSQPPSGILGDLMIGNAAMSFLDASFTLSNGLWVRNDEYGVAAASELLRREMGGVEVAIKSRAEDETILYDLTEAGTNAGVFLQGGYTEGNCMAVRMPQVEFKVPGTDDPETEVNWDFKGMGLESSDNVNDVLFFALG